MSAKLEKMGPYDNLVIFYGGHGFYRDDLRTAYWVPLHTSGFTDYISNQDITTLLNGTHAKHVLIIADACFSGAMRSGIATPARYEFKLPSRQLLTSGGIEKVSGNSVFVAKLLESLKVSSDPYVSVKELYNLVYNGMKGAKATLPLLMDMESTTGGAGQFYFERHP